MSDIVDQQTRSRMMAGIRGKDTKPERIVRSALHARGFRYRLNVRSLPGSPDLVFQKWKAVVFVHGCFWHRHEGCQYATTPSSNPDFWKAKFEANTARDAKNLQDLHASGWRAAVVWECSLKKGKEDDVIARVSEFLIGEEVFLEVPE